MSLKLKINTGKASSPDGGGSSIPPTPSAGSAGATSAAGGSFKIKLGASQPPTPASEPPSGILSTSNSASKSRQSTGSKAKAVKLAEGSKKRAADDDTISPAAKRLAKQKPTVNRKISLKGPVAPPSAITAGGAITPSSAGSVNKLLLRRKSTQPKLRTLNVKRPPPPRLPGHGYDSEDSEAEEDPAIQQAFILRMEDGEDANYIRDAIANGKIGAPPHENPAQVSIRFIEKEHRRAIISVRGRKYAAALVDLPCIVETMKSWDKKGWWKVADISQMLLVLGLCNNDEEARSMPLPADMDKNNLQYPHGLTPPMHWVRKRRFRKRLSYKTIANVEEEVERLLREDEAVEAHGGDVELNLLDRAELERSRDEQSQDEEGDAIETVENGDGEEYEEYYDEEADADLEGNLQAMFDEDHAAASSVPLAESVLESPKPMLDQAASFLAVENALASTSPATGTETPAEAQETTQDEQSSDEDESDEEDSPDVVDEDAAAKAAERNQQLEEVADLEREVELQKRKVESMKNQLLKERAIAQLRTLEEDLRVKKVAAFGVDGEGDDDVDD